MIGAKDKLVDVLDHEEWGEEKRAREERRRRYAPVLTWGAVWAVAARVRPASA